MTTNEMIAAIKALKVGNDVTLGDYAVVKYGKRNYHVFAASDIYGQTLMRCEHAYGVAVFIDKRESVKEIA